MSPRTAGSNSYDSPFTGTKGRLLIHGLKQSLTTKKQEASVFTTSKPSVIHGEVQTQSCEFSLTELFGLNLATLCVILLWVNTCRFLKLFGPAKARTFDVFVLVSGTRNVWIKLATFPGTCQDYVFWMESDLFITLEKDLLLFGHFSLSTAISTIDSATDRETVLQTKIRIIGVNCILLNRLLRTETILRYNLVAVSPGEPGLVLNVRDQLCVDRDSI